MKTEKGEKRKKKKKINKRSVCFLTVKADRLLHVFPYTSIPKCFIIKIPQISSSCIFIKATGFLDKPVTPKLPFSVGLCENNSSMNWQASAVTQGQTRLYDFMNFFTGLT